jgi:hypothetical protein
MKKTQKKLNSAFLQKKLRQWVLITQSLKQNDICLKKIALKIAYD